MCQLLRSFSLLCVLYGIASHCKAVSVEGPLSPEAALREFEAAPGLRVELVAAEPLTASPCALAFDSKGRLFVAENRGYPIGVPEGHPGAGVVALLEDTDGDGRMDRRTVFAEGLSFPNGVLPWKDGLIVTCAPDVLFLRDSKGTGRADEKRVLLTGFATSGSTQLRVNCPTIGPDGWIYLAAGLSGGTLTCPEHPERTPLKMVGDVRFHPETLEVELVDGRSQYGMSFDPAGRRFICMNRAPVQQVVFASRWLRRNPNLNFSETVQDCNQRTVQSLLGGGGVGVRLYPISSNITTADSHAGSFSAACGVHIWRGSGLPEAYEGCALACDPTGNLVHADRLVDRGAAFTAEPLLEKREMLASRDDWFRPVFLAKGPDEALYVADMYRKVIEHPDYLPVEVRKHTDFESGKDKGRIWRVVSSERRPPGKAQPVVRLEQAWADAAVPADEGGAQKWLEERLDAARAESPRTRFLAAVALGNIDRPESTRALASIALRDSEDRWTRTAVLSGISGREVQLLELLLAQTSYEQARRPGTQELFVFLGGCLTEPATLARVLSTMRDPRSEVVFPLLLGHLERTRVSFAKVAAAVEYAVGPGGDGSGKIQKLLQEIPSLATDLQRSGAERMPAVRLLSAMPWEVAGAPLGMLAEGERGEELRTAAVRAFARFERPEVAERLLAGWSGCTPALRDTIAGALLSSSFHTRIVLGAIESGRLPANAISGVRRKQILKHKDPDIRERAEKLLVQSDAGRQQVFEEAKAALKLSAVPAHGREIFQQACASCHRLDRVGHPVGPDLLDIRNQPKETILFHILVPDAEISPVFTAYIAETRDGKSFGGVLASETPESITLRGPLSTETSLSRRDLSKLEALNSSLMPNGFENALSRQDLADLVAFLKGDQ
jgi:putative membrane-bound dehydrogenase-like protein